MNIKLIFSIGILFCALSSPYMAKALEEDNTSGFGTEMKIISCDKAPMDSISKKELNTKIFQVVVIVNFSKKISHARLKKIKQNMENKFGLKQSGFGRDYDVQLVSRRPKNKTGERLLKLRIKSYGARHVRFRITIAKGGMYF